MLKLIYTEAAPHFELLTSNLEDWVEQRLRFATSMGEEIFVSAETASFLLPEVVCEATALNFYFDRENVTTVTASKCDLDRVEIELDGYWLSDREYSAEGIFITRLPDRVESYLWQLWHNAERQSVASDGAIG
ncbi:alr0857 family protein [Chamaesiphon sp. GL140_3_metabinner_50]|uniref:alr0857 family protein n=1 Tax=Chamaesiphon sp. GL140_3_metabinner_50 TaxID=2970812 RepID=UPI0025CCC4AC|nr:alr0857 family protein [Chamaesiphon sp. GL140_3_metabinner_50]